MGHVLKPSCIFTENAVSWNFASIRKENMPTEHEYKYLLSLELAKDFDHPTLLKMSKEHQHIKQGYLAFSKGMTTRIRCIDDGEKQKWFLTFKQKVEERVIEIEKRLDDRDGQDLWSVCVGKLKKYLYFI